MSARFEYDQVDNLADVQARAGEGWRAVAMGIVQGRHSGESAVAVYLLERPVFESAPAPGSGVGFGGGLS